MRPSGRAPDEMRAQFMDGCLAHHDSVAHRTLAKQAGQAKAVIA
jgi:hypothetical protein